MDIRVTSFELLNFFKARRYIADLNPKLTKWKIVNFRKQINIFASKVLLVVAVVSQNGKLEWGFHGKMIIQSIIDFNIVRSLKKLILISRNWASVLIYTLVIHVCRFVLYEKEPKCFFQLAVFFTPRSNNSDPRN